MRALRRAEQEHNYAIGLDSGGRVIVVHLVAIGTVDKVQAHPRDIFRELIRVNAARFIYVHNHPTGPRRSSESDRQVTSSLMESGEWLGVPLDAHLLVAGDGDPIVVGPMRKTKKRAAVRGL